MMPFRLPFGGRIDRTRPLEFRFDGRRYSGYAGDTLASALLANGVHTVGRSFKYHRRRGIHAAGFDEPNALVELREGARREPNTRATTIELYDGLVARSQNRWPSLDFDLMAVNDWFKPLLAAGFYYKTFMWPASFWERVYEPIIRRAAGLGRASALPDPDRYERSSAHCDLLVVGAGVAGLAAALTAGRAGARVILCEDHREAGGRLLAERTTVGGIPGGEWLSGVLAELAVLSNVQILTRTTVVGGYDGGTWLALERVTDHLPAPSGCEPRQRLWQVIARAVVLATGATERSLAFPDNDRPGVMLASAVRSYLNRHAVLPGERIGIYTATDEGWTLAQELVEAGHPPAVVVDYRPQVPAPWRDLTASIPTLTAGRVTGTLGRRRLHAVEVAGSGGASRFAVDVLAVSGGFNPEIGLSCMFGVRPQWSEREQAFLAGPQPGPLSIAGAAAAEGALADAWLSGSRAAVERLAGLDRRAEPVTPLAVPTAPRQAAVAAFWPPGHPRAARVFLDLQHDVTAADVELAHREGYRSVEHLKRYTTLGMGTDQGRGSSVDGIALMARLMGRPIAEGGAVIARAPVVPLAIAPLAGQRRGTAFRPRRRTPVHALAESLGASFLDVGQWQRPLAFPRPGETIAETVTREVRTVREAVGVTDVSTLGKIEVEGPDAPIFLDRICATRPSHMQVGRASYLVLLREDGFLMDDGLLVRLGEGHYVMHVSTAHAAAVWRHVLFCRQVLWPRLVTSVTAVTDAWAQLAIAGPRSSSVVARLVDAACGYVPAGFPMQAAREVTVCGGVPARLAAVSFSGERAYEIAVPTGHGESLFRRVLDIGSDVGIAPYGTEAMSVMRIEKGNLGAAEINGQTTAHDVGLGRMLAEDRDYIGRTLSRRPALLDPGRQRLVGLKPLDVSQRFKGGAHVVPGSAPADAAHDQGWLSSVAWSPTLGHSIALAFVAGGPDRIGERVRVVDPLRGAEDILAEIVPSVFVDPERKRQHVE